jgi:putative membrane protein
MWIRALAAMAAVAGLSALPGCERDENRGSSSSRKDRDIRASGNPDHAFMMAAAQSNLAEIETGRLAMEKGSHPEVKQFGHHMVEDHGRANEELAELAKKKGVALPDKPDEAHQQDAARLKELSGAEFDKRYAGMMVADHVKAVALFEEKAKQAQDPDVRAFAEKTAPKLREHLKMARDLNAKVGGTNAD